jgi:hypothetical protein
MNSSIPLNANFKELSCQLGGLRLNGKVTYSGSISPPVTGGTAESLNVLIIDDSAAAQTLSKTITGKFLQIKVGSDQYYIPLYS